MNRDRIDALNALADKVEAGGEVTARLWMQAFGISPDDRSIMAARAYHGSLDAAKALHEALLPEYDARIFLSGEAWVYIPTMCAPPEHEERADINGMPARSLLLCIIKVEIWKEEQ